MNELESGKVWSTPLQEEEPAVPAKKYRVDVTEAARATLAQWLRRGTPSARKLTRARGWRKADAGWHDHDIADAVDPSRRTVERMRKRCMPRRVGALAERPRPGT